MYFNYLKPLSEEFIRENQNKIDWDYISCYQKLSEDFIREFQDKVDWNWISEYQKLSVKFIREFQNKMNWHCLLEKYKYNLSFKNNKYQIKFANYNSDCLEYNEFVDLVLRLISLKIFQ